MSNVATQATGSAGGRDGDHRGGSRPGRSSQAGSEPPPGPATPARGRDAPASFLLGLNTSTIRGHKLSIVEEIAIAAKAGYRGMEPWVDELERYAASGVARGPGQAVPRRRHLRRERDRLLRVDRGRSGPAAEGAGSGQAEHGAGRRRSAASGWPPRRSGRPTDAMPDLLHVAERYRALLELGDQMGVVPQVEVWGFSRTLGRLGEAALVAMEAAPRRGLHPARRLSPLPRRLRSGRDQAAGAPRDPRLPLQRLPGRSAPREADRRRPGLSRRRRRAARRRCSATWPMAGSRSCCRSSCSTGKYWTQDPLTVARTGFEKMKALVKSVRTR